LFYCDFAISTALNELTHVCTGILILRPVFVLATNTSKDVADLSKSKKSLSDIVDVYDEMDKPVLL